MKYFNSLTEVENQVIRLSELRNLFSVVTNGLDSSSIDEIKSTVYYIENSLSDISAQLSDKFQNLFNNIREQNDE